ncbi:MAG: HAMP domain-containing sensor histidine kinase [Chitinophagales bacterium]
MNLYDKTLQWKIALIAAALIIVAISLYYSQSLANQLANEERKKIELYGKAVNEIKNIFSFMNQKEQLDPLAQKVLEEYESNILAFLQEITTSNTTIPVIQTNGKDQITGTRNLDPNDNERTFDLKNLEDAAIVMDELEAMKNSFPPIEISARFNERDDEGNETGKILERKSFIYYNESSILQQLRTYPLFQLFIISIFLLIAYVAFDAARRAEQNKVWLGMAKETAHQLGTPLFSMVGWVEMLKISEDPSGEAQMVGEELEKDVGRLQLIADRFSKIGAQPKLSPTNIVESVKETTTYMRRRASKQVVVSFESAQPEIRANVNNVLFDWVIENLIRNGLDSMGPEGKLDVKMWEEAGKVIIEVTDSGKGIPKSKFKTVFKPGYSTKKRGWGLGLSLSKRIVEMYHKGKIFVAQSVLDQGTTFRVVVPVLED